MQNLVKDIKLHKFEVYLELLSQIWARQLVTYKK